MIHPVTVTNPKGKVLRVITSESLEARSKAICMAGDGHFASHKIREGKCERPGCSTPFWTKQRGKKYCSRECTNIVARRVAKETKARRKERLAKEREAV